MGRVVGFNEKDADDLLNLIGDVESVALAPEPRYPIVRLYIAKLTSAWSGTAPNGTASADLHDMTKTSMSTSVTVRDPLAIFSTLTTNDYLICFFQDGNYYALQAPC